MIEENKQLAEAKTILREILEDRDFRVEGKVTQEILDQAFSVHEMEIGVGIYQNTVRLHDKYDLVDAVMPIGERMVAMFTEELGNFKIEAGQIWRQTDGEWVPFVLSEEGAKTAEIKWMKWHEGSEDVERGLYFIDRDGFTKYYLSEDGEGKAVEGLVICYPEVRRPEPMTVVNMLPEEDNMAGHVMLNPEISKKGWKYVVHYMVANNLFAEDYRKEIGITSSNQKPDTSSR